MKDKMIEESMALSTFIYNKYFTKYFWLRDELISEGYIALVKASNLYDNTRNCKFSTFACTYIYYAMKRYLASYIKKGWLDNVCLDDFTPGNTVYTYADVIPAPQEDTDEDISNDRLFSYLFKNVSSRAKQIFELYLQDVPLKEIADMLGISCSLASNYITRIKKKLRAHVNEGKPIKGVHKSGEHQAVLEEARRLGVSVRTIYRRRARERLSKERKERRERFVKTNSNV